MMYILGKLLCTKMLQASSGIQPLLQAYVHSQEATILLQEKVSPTEDTSLLEALPTTKQEIRRWTFFWVN